MTEERRIAIERIAAKRRFMAHVTVFGVVATLVVAVWASRGGGYFWPVFILAGWGIHLVFCGVGLYRRPITKAQIADEMRRVGVGVGR